MIILSGKIRDPVVQVRRMRIYMARVGALAVARGSVAGQAPLNKKYFTFIDQVCIRSIALIASSCIKNYLAVRIFASSIRLRNQGLEILGFHVVVPQSFNIGAEVIYI